MVYATRGLAEVLLEYAGRHDPASVTVPLSATPAGELGVGLPEVPADARVFTHFYLPDAGDSIEAVFGVDLGIPPGRTPGIFVSHPDGRIEVRRTDELRQVILVAVPPWDDGSLAAFDRRGRRQPLSLVDAVLPDESIP